MGHGLLSYFLDAAEGRFPPDDGRCVIVPPLPRGLRASVAFTGHAVIAADVTPVEVAEHGGDGFGGSMAPHFLRWLAGPGGDVGVLDATLVARGRGGGGLSEVDDIDHPRVALARRLREDVRVFADHRGLVTLAAGLAGRRELSVELTGDRGIGHGRALVRDALGMVPAGQPVFAAVSPGNARSLRAFLALGFAPIGSEVIIEPVVPGGDGCSAVTGA